MEDERFEGGPLPELPSDAEVGPDEKIDELCWISYCLQFLEKTCLNLNAVSLNHWKALLHVVASSNVKACSA
jgi:hypothetical protein